MDNNTQVRIWLYRLLAKLEQYKVVDATQSSFENFGENIELKIHFGDDFSELEDDK